MDRARARRATATCRFESDCARREPVPGLRTTLPAVSVTSAQRHSSAPARRRTSTPASVMRQGYQHVGRAGTDDCWEREGCACEVRATRAGGEKKVPEPPGGARARAGGKGLVVDLFSRACERWMQRRSGKNFVRFAVVCGRFRPCARGCYGLQPRRVHFFLRLSRVIIA